MALLLTGVAGGCFLVVRPFVSAILWAAILVFSTWPLYVRLQARLRLGRGGTAALIVATGILLVVLPLAMALPSGADDAAQLGASVQALTHAGLPAAPGWLERVPLVGGPCRRCLESLGG